MKSLCRCRICIALDHPASGPWPVSQKRALKIQCAGSFPSAFFRPVFGTAQSLDFFCLLFSSKDPFGFPLQLFLLFPLQFFKPPLSVNCTSLGKARNPFLLSAPAPLSDGSCRGALQQEDQSDDSCSDIDQNAAGSTECAEHEGCCPSSNDSAAGLTAAKKSWVFFVIVALQAIA